MTSKPAIRVTTTEGRQRLPDLIQTVAIERSVVIFHRYGRDLAALVPLNMLPAEGEAVLKVPKCAECGAYFPETSGEFCHRAACPHLPEAR